MKSETQVDLLWFSIMGIVRQNKHYDEVVWMTGSYYVVNFLRQILLKKSFDLNMFHHLITPLSLYILAKKHNTELLSKIITQYNLTVAFLLLAKDNQDTEFGLLCGILCCMLWLRFRIYDTAKLYMNLPYDPSLNIILLFLGMNIFWFMKIIEKIIEK